MTTRPTTVVPSLTLVEGGSDDDLDLLLAWCADPTLVHHDPDLLVHALTTSCDETDRAVHRSFGVCTTCRATPAHRQPVGQSSVSGASSHA